MKSHSWKLRILSFGFRPFWSPNWRLRAPTKINHWGSVIPAGSREEAWKLPYPCNKISTLKIHMDATLLGYIWLHFYFRLKPPMIVFLRQRTKKIIFTPSPRTNILLPHNITEEQMKLLSRDKQLFERGKWNVMLNCTRSRETKWHDFESTAWLMMIWRNRERVIKHSMSSLTGAV